MKTERQEELEMLIEKTRDKMVRDAEVIQHLNYEDSYKDQSFLDDILVYVERLKRYQNEIAEL
jgi:hypothetical protein